MPNLTQSLQNQDLGHLNIIAEFWGLELIATDTQSAIPDLEKFLCDQALVDEIVSALPTDAQDALLEILHDDGRIPWSIFTRRFGQVREMGAGRRDREQPFRNPISPAEILWYRTFIARAFFATSTGPQEFAYIPDELIPFIRVAISAVTHVEKVTSEGREGQRGKSLSELIGRRATPGESSFPLLVTDRILDDICTLLAALRIEFLPENISPLTNDYWVPASIIPVYSIESLEELLTIIGLLDSGGTPIPNVTRSFLEASRGEALSLLVEPWLKSVSYNDLKLMPHLHAEGEWDNDPLRTRMFILNLLMSIPADTWWSLSSFVAAIRQAQPDFQRPAGDYNSWFIKDDRTGEYMRGFEHWDDVDGALIRYLITGPFHWLGILDLASTSQGTPVSAFRFSRWAVNLLEGNPPDDLENETDVVYIRSNGDIHISRLVPRTARYQISRFCEWEGLKGGKYIYRIIPSSLERARQQNLRVSQLISLLRRYAETVPPSIERSLNRWEEHGSEARIEQVDVLRLGSPKMMQAVRKSRASRFLGDPLGPTCVIVKPGARKKVLAILLGLGYLGDESDNIE